MKLRGIISLSLILGLSLNLNAKPLTYVTVEEARVKSAEKAMPLVFEASSADVVSYIETISRVNNEAELSNVLIQIGEEMWQKHKHIVQTSRSFDDRPLYWTRLSVLKELRGLEVFRSAEEAIQEQLVESFELASRGNSEIDYSSGLKKIFVTGFDPFLLDRNLKQSNPSGVTALWLDGKIIEHNGEKAQIEAVVVPVRFGDFDQGMIENILIPMFAEEKVAMLTTVSMGRDDFDLERFPGLRRSSPVPDNVNVFTGANKARPLKPFLYNQELNGPEFVQFSLPVESMQQAQGKYKINDRHVVSTLTKTDYEPQTLEQLDGETAVAGAGGGYLSNEISYRSILLRNQIAPNTAVGHIHTPRYKDWDKNNVAAIVLQIEAMLKLSLTEI